MQNTVHTAKVWHEIKTDPFCVVAHQIRAHCAASSFFSVLEFLSFPNTVIGMSLMSAPGIMTHLTF